MWAGQIYLVLLRLMLKANRAKVIKEVPENLWMVTRAEHVAECLW